MALLSTFVPIYLLSLVALSTSSKERDKRYIQINPDSPMTLGFLWNAPVALILPTLAPKDGDKFDQLFRSDVVDPEEEFAEDNYVTEEDSGSEAFHSTSSRSFKKSFEIAQELFVDTAYQKQTDKLLMFFSMLKMPYLECQERIICEMASDSYAYSPISSYILRELKLNHGPITLGKTSLMWRYVEAARQGIVSDDGEVCSRKYKKCPLPTYKIINMSVVKVLQYLTEVFNMKIV